MRQPKSTLVDTIISPELSSPVGNFAHANSVRIVENSSILFISGMTARDETGAVVGPNDITAQTEKVFENIAAVLRPYGASFADIVRVDVFLTDMENFSSVHEVRNRLFGSEVPASTMLEVSRMVSPEMLIEVTAIAAIQSSNQETDRRMQ